MTKPLQQPPIHNNNNNHNNNNKTNNNNKKRNNVDRILFGSCNSQHYKSVLWDTIISRQSNAFIWVGDAIYGDDFHYVFSNNTSKTKVSNEQQQQQQNDVQVNDDNNNEVSLLRRYLPSLVGGKKVVKEATPNDLINAYNDLLQHPGYNKLIHTLHISSTDFDTETDDVVTATTTTTTTILGTFDDHDYGINNGDKLYQYKIESAIAYMDFIKKSNHIIDVTQDDSVIPTPNTDENDTVLSKSRNHREHSRMKEHNNMFNIMEQRARTGKGVYGVKIFDFERPQDNYILTDEEAGLEPGTTTTTTVTPLSNRSVAIILLDVRTNKDPWPIKTSWWRKKMNQFTNKNMEPTDSSNIDDGIGDFLGIEQWEWLEYVLNKSTASINIIVQGLQVHADRYFDGNAVEDWSQFPLAQHHLYQLLSNKQTQSLSSSAVVLVSGDVHMAELLRRDCRKVNHNNIKNDQNKNTNNDNYNRMLLEVTTSGMTHSWGTNICARPHSGITCRISYFHTALKYGMHFAHHNSVWSDLVHLTTTKNNNSDNDIGRGYVINDNDKVGVQYSLERNFGEFEFDWDYNQLIIRIIGQQQSPIAVNHNKYLLNTQWNLDLLSGKIPPSDNYLNDNDFYKQYHKLIQYNQLIGDNNNNNNYNHLMVHDDDWFCVNYQHDPSYLFKLFGVLSPVSISACIIFTPIILILYALYQITIRYRRHRRHWKKSKIIRPPINKIKDQ